MNGFEKRAIFVVLISVIACGLVVLVWEARSILLLLFAGYIGALILTTLTKWLQSWLHLRHRGLAFTLVVCVIIASAACGIWLRGPVLAQKLSDLQIDIAAAAQQLSSHLQEQKWARWVIAHSAESGQASHALSLALSGIGGAVYLTVSTIAGVFLVVITTLYLAAEPDFYLRGLRRLLPISPRPTIEACFAKATEMLQIWLMAKLVSMVAIGSFVTVGLLLLRVPLAGTLGVIAGLLTFIPNLGPILSVLPATLLAFEISPTKGILTIALFCCAHILEGNLVTPLAERKIVALPPALTLTVQLLLATIAGALGIALAAPLTAVMLGVLQVLLPKEGQFTSPDSTRPLEMSKI